MSVCLSVILWNLEVLTHLKMGVIGSHRGSFFLGAIFRGDPPKLLTREFYCLLTCFLIFLLVFFFSLGGVKNFAQNLITLSYLLHIVYSQMTYMNFWGKWGDGGGN